MFDFEYNFPYKKGKHIHFISDSIGIIYASRDLQYESATSYEFAVIAYDLGQPSLSSTASVYINATLPLVVPAPYFASSNYHVQVSADTPVDTVIFIATAGVHRYVYTITGMFNC